MDTVATEHAQDMGVKGKGFLKLTQGIHKLMVQKRLGFCVAY